MLQDVFLHQQPMLLPLVHATCVTRRHSCQPYWHQCTAIMYSAVETGL